MLSISDILKCKKITPPPEKISFCLSSCLNLISFNKNLRKTNFNLIRVRLDIKQVWLPESTKSYCGVEDSESHTANDHLYRAAPGESGSEVRGKGQRRPGGQGPSQ